MALCVVCKNEVSWEVTQEVFEDYLEQMDSYGKESLTENAQVAVEGKVCSLKCYSDME